jgi:uncharacterized protein HemX
MSLTPCRECGQEVSAYAKTCPQCGVTMPGRDAPEHDATKRQGRRIGAGIVGLIFALAIGGGIYSYHQDQVKKDRHECEARVNRQAVAAHLPPDLSVCS